MSIFKEVIEEDVFNTFLNSCEFAEAEDSYLVNGRTMHIIIDTLEYQNRQKVSQDRIERVYLKQLLIYVSAAELGYEPKIDSLLTLQKAGEEEIDYVVTNCINEDGIYSISLEVSR